MVAQSKPMQIPGQNFGVLGESKTFDYIVVGGGNGGNAIAARLAENPNITVAVVEAGGFYELENGIYSQIPGYCRKYAIPILAEGDTIIDPQPLIDWHTVIEPQSELNNRRFRYGSGKTLGGGSARNFMLYHRPTVGTMEKWATEVGDPSYTWDSVFPLFNQSLQFHAPETSRLSTDKWDPAAFTKADHGPVHVSYPYFRQPMTTKIEEELLNAGMKDGVSLNSGSLDGFAHCPFTINPADGFRSCSETSFLRSALGQDNFTVYIKTEAQKILFNDNKEATGVRVNTAGVEYTLHANKEVIVSCGSFRSPHLLMLSGIGPAHELKKHGVPVVADRPGVGQNLSDHFNAEMIWPINVWSLSALQDPMEMAKEASQFLKTAQGPMSSVGCDIFVFEKIPEHLRKNLSHEATSTLSQFPSDWPELEFIPLSFTFNPTSFDPKKPDFYMSIQVVNTACLSRGTVTLASASPADPPVIQPNYFTHPTDHEVMIAGLRRAREIAAMLSSNLISGPEYSPGEDSVKTESEDDIKGWVRSAGAPFVHAMGSCKMGKPDDGMAVVDSQAKVIGVRGLRVVDTSAFPFGMPGHPQSVVYMLAEKISHDILSNL